MTEWKLTPKGLKIFNKCKEVLPALEEAIKKDAYLRQFLSEKKER